MENNYTVYKHIFPNNKVYIGITRRKPQRRWNNGKAYYHNQFMVRAIQKYGWANVKHEILYEHLTKEEAEQKEIELIAQNKSNQQEYGYNIENGGNHQGKMNDKIRMKISKSSKGKHLSQETKDKIRNTLKGTRHGISLINMKPIDMFDLNMDYIKSYDCMKDCERETGIPMQHISLCCHKKLRKTHGYIFRFKI